MKRLVLAAVVVAGLVGVAAGFGLARLAGDDRQEEVAARGAIVMPFDLDGTTHIFTPTENGGVEEVVSDDAADRRQVRFIRAHLREEAAKFERGDFSDPRSIHGRDMPGLATLEARADELEIRYEELPNGARIRFVAEDPSLVSAVHEWFAAQVSDHGAHAESG